MKRIFFIFFAIITVIVEAGAVNNYVPKKFNTITSHNDVYPYRLNNTKTNTNTKETSSATTSRRAVVPRSKTARATTSVQTQAQRRVVQRTNTNARVASTNNVRTNPNTIRASANTRIRNANNTRVASTNYYTSTEKPSSQRCFADYKECMDGYCQREDTAYNRCYCSAKLAQIDSRYQNKIDELIQQIIRLQYSTNATSDEIKDYWDETIGSYSKENQWVNIDNALDIEWADTQSRINGQNAFNTGHEYCSQHLRACYYMSSNLRDAYKSEITRDCATYEKSLQKIQAAAESVIESYHD